MVSSGDSQRTASSMAWGSSDRSALTASNCVGIRQQREQQVAQRAVGRLDAGGQQQPQEREDLLVFELVAVDFGGGERADQILFRLGSASLKNRREVVTQRGGGAQSAFRVHQPAQQRDRPPLELRVVLLWQPEQTRDDLARIVEGELLDQIRPAVRGEVVDQAVGDAPNEFILPARQRLLRERLLHQRPQPAVHRFVHPQHHALTEHRTERRDDARRREASRCRAASAESPRAGTR